jgi:hypothetical protein
MSGRKTSVAGPCYAMDKMNRLRSKINLRSGAMGQSFYDLNQTSGYQKTHRDLQRPSEFSFDHHEDHNDDRKNTVTQIGKKDKKIVKPPAMVLIDKKETLRFGYRPAKYSQDNREDEVAFIKNWILTNGLTQQFHNKVKECAAKLNASPVIFVKYWLSFG